MRSPADLEPEVVVAQTLPLGLVRDLHGRGVRLVFDLYAPALVEAAAQLAEEAGGQTRRASATRRCSRRRG